METTEHSRPPRVLLADDQVSMLKALRLLLKGEGYEIETVASAPAIVEAIARRDFDVVLMDLNYVRGSTSGQEGLELRSKVQQIDSTLPVVVMTAWGSSNRRTSCCAARTAPPSSPSPERCSRCSM
jgi:DNA-binding NtrC family response regulator